MLSSIVSPIMAAIKSTKTLMVAFILTVIIVRYMGIGDVPGRKSMEFALNFLAIFFTFYLALLFIYWSCEKTGQWLSKQTKDASQSESILKKLSLLTLDEKSSLAL